MRSKSSVGKMRKVYRGRDVEVTFDLDICIHVGECLRGDPKVFKLQRRPWVLRRLPEMQQLWALSP